jgi:hypothetical protein
MLENKNQYDPVAFRCEFESTELYERIAADFDHIVYESVAHIMHRFTPRQVWGERWFFARSLYYIRVVTEIPYVNLYDLGCGRNKLKEYLPNVIGVDVNRPLQFNKFYADVEATVNDKYVASHQNSFLAVISINALHFRPIDEIAQIVKEFNSMIANGGRGYISLNVIRLLERGTKFTITSSVDQIDSFVRQELDTLNLKFLVVDINLADIDDYIDGNIHLVIEKPL